MTQKTWWVSDTHFFHKNIILYSNRPFASKEEMEARSIQLESVKRMNDAMVQAWNDKVSPEDTVWHLGDFALTKDRDGASRILDKLNGHKHLVRGNHDPSWVCNLPQWESVQDYKEQRIEGKNIVLCHYAMRVWNRSHHGALMFYGHSHATLPGNSQSVDVGVDNWDYAPIGLDEILARLKTLPPYDQKMNKYGE